MSKKPKILVLVHKHLIPPKTSKGHNLDRVSWRTEYYVVSELKNLGYDFRVLGVESDLKVIRESVEVYKPDLAFNLLEAFDYEVVFDHNVVSYLELIKLPYTGCNPKGLLISRDKSLTKKLLMYHRIKTPEFFVVERGKRLNSSHKLEFPLIVKALNEEGSSGISQNSIVKDKVKLEERIQYIHEKQWSDALVETYIEGRDIYVSLLGNKKVTVFPIIELVFQNAPENIHQIATKKAKWNQDYRKKYQISFKEPKALTEAEQDKIVRLSRRIYKILGLNGYARFDLRLAENGEVYFLEANPNPDVAKHDEFALSAKKAGINYTKLIEKIVQAGVQWKPVMTYR